VLGAAAERYFQCFSEHLTLYLKRLGVWAGCEGLRDELSGESQAF